MDENQIVASSTAERLPQGGWEGEIGPNIPEGLHTVVVSDEVGNTDEALLYVDKPGMVDRITNVLPPVLGVSFIFFLIIILVLAANTIRLGRLADKHEVVERMRLHLRHAIYFATAMVVLALVAGLSLNLGTSLFDRTIGRLWPAKNGVILHGVSGVLHDLSGTPVKGITLVAGDTVITTSDSGMFVFSDVPGDQGIQLAHPDLSMAFNKEVQGDGKMDVLFEIGALQSLIEIARLEAAGNSRTLYKQLFVEHLKNGYSQDTFVGEYRSRFTQDDIFGGTIYLGNISRLDTYQSRLTGENFIHVIRAEVFTGSGTAEYLLTNDQGKWKLVF